MDGETLRSRVAQLVQKTRKAVRLYSSAERLAGGEQAQFTSLQLDQWQQINSELQRQLAAAVDRPHQRFLASEVVTVRDRFYHEWRNAESEVHMKQRELLSAAEKGDFVRCAVLGRALVVVKAREQAAQAALHELQDLIDKARIDPRTNAGSGASEPQQRELISPSGGAEKLVGGVVESEAVSAEPPVTSARSQIPQQSPILGKVIPLRRQGL